MSSHWVNLSCRWHTGRPPSGQPVLPAGDVVRPGMEVCGQILWSGCGGVLDGSSSAKSSVFLRPEGPAIRLARAGGPGH